MAHVAARPAPHADVAPRLQRLSAQLPVPLAYFVALAGALLFLAAHLAFLPASLEDVDSINFALGLRQFDVAHHQPHPPGYPLFIALGKFVHGLGASEVHALALLGVVSGALAILALVALYRQLDDAPTAGRPFDSSVTSESSRAGSRDGTLRVAPSGVTDSRRPTDDGRPPRALLAAALAASAPLYWFTASRPLSDMTGLAAAVAVQALTLAAVSDGALVGASALAAFAGGLRSQIVWLTVPLLLWRLARLDGGRRLRVGVRALGAFVAGGLAWGIPLIVLSGGPAAYLRALSEQGAEDLTGVRMLWTTPTARELLASLYYAFVAPWAVAWMAAIVLVLAAIGVARLTRERSGTLTPLAFAFVPYLAFDMLFQETVTTRYSLPLIVPIAYLAVCGLVRLRLPRGAVVAAVVALVAFDAHVGGTSVAAYAKEKAPAFRLIGDMQAIHGIAPSVQPVLATHRREWFDLRRPVAWTGDAMPPIARQLPAPPKHEWLELVKYWNGGGRDLVWFVADPLRTDLALVDHPARPNGSYRWTVPYPVLLGGVRPAGMDWFALQPPGWYLGEGWSLTPETAGVAREDRRGPGLAPIEGWIRRRIGPVTLMIGGRNLATSGPPAHARVAIDGRTIDEPVVPPGFFLKMIDLPAGALEGSGDYATITVAADSPRFAVEQFDAQPADRVVFGFGDGWHEAEYNPVTGLAWRWTSERAVVPVHAAGRSVVLTMTGEPPSVYFGSASHLRFWAGGRLIAQRTLSDSFDVRVIVPGDLLRGDNPSITIETDQMYVPAERSRRSPDRRHLGLRVFEARVDSLP